VLEETDLSGNLINDYIYFGGRRLVRQDASGNDYYYFADPLGTVKGIVSGTALCYDADFYPFGGEKVFTNTCAQNYKFTGLERDTETGLDDTLYRMYSSGLGRWLTPDPKVGCGTNPQNLDRYNYVLDNPTTFVDPRGDQPQMQPCGFDCAYAQTGSHDPVLCGHCLGCCLAYTGRFIEGCIGFCFAVFFPPQDLFDLFFFTACVGNCLTLATFDVDYCLYNFGRCLTSQQGAVRACCLPSLRPPYSF